MLVRTADGPIRLHVSGAGSPVVMLPSLGRGASDFDRLAADVAAAGYRVVCPEPRGIGGRATAAWTETLARIVIGRLDRRWTERA